VQADFYPGKSYINQHIEHQLPWHIAWSK